MIQLDPWALFEIGIPAASGGVAGVVGVTVYRRLRHGDARTGLARPYVVLAVVVSLLGIGYAGLHAATPLWNLPLGSGILLLAVPWTTFAARYIGIGRYVTLGRVFAGILAVTVLVGVNVFGRLIQEGWITTSLVGNEALQTLETAQSVVTLALLTLVFGLIGGVVVATYRHDRLSTVQGLLVVLPIAGFIFTVQTTRPATPLLNDVLIGSTFLVVAAGLTLGVTRYDVVTRVPATRRLGERAALTETDEAIVVLDDRARVVRVNEPAERMFGGAQTLADVTDHSVTSLTEHDTITCRTTAGRRQFEPSVSPLVDGYEETFGYTVMLIDVTDREIRRQRLAVLNRILRHNVRNELDVIRAHAEEVDLAPAVDGVDRLSALSEQARRIQDLMERSAADRTEVRLRPHLEAVVADATAGVSADVTVTAPDVSVTIDPERCRYVIDHLVENAVEHNDGESPRVVVRAERTEADVRLVVADDGPGIPESERAVIEAGGETPLEHASSLGLWGTNWAVQSMGGSLSFDESDLGGTAVTVSLTDVAVLDA
ncbi:sensor histidine kinase [Halorientalis pallida]|uniref:histidine kinase n=1 Tax=Halorientalis pallida TaxID=2479928 RepID=A0A498L0B4_9EURY|nr:PAS domain-containing sensor histidine kinase [Halorientalis pallida]RXK47943.1 PAS domain-containing sensor histidine kinase [Halorientalis pallida]